VGVAVARSYYYAPAYYYSAPACYYTPSVYFSPVGLNLNVPFVSLSMARRPTAAVAPTDAGLETIPAPRPLKPAQPNGTFPYDGGPANPVPMPQAEPAPNRAAPRTIVPEGRVVSLQAKAPKYSYPAYGEKPASRPAADRQLAAKSAK
jgi:hypothetical protein